MEIRPHRIIKRKITKKIKVGNVSVGGDSQISIQSMTNTLTTDIKGTIDQIHSLEEAGVDIVRVSCPDEGSTKALKKIVKEVSVPIVADIHFHYKRAIEAAEMGASCLRINPGNIGTKQRVLEVIKAAKNNKLHELLKAEEKYSKQIYTDQEFCQRVFKLASEYGYLRLVGELKDKEEFAEIVKNKEFINQCFLLAFDNQHSQMLRCLLNINGNDNKSIGKTIRDEDDNDLVLRCLLKGNYLCDLKIKILKLLQTTYGMDLNSVNKDGMNVYLSAAKMGSIDVLKYLDQIYTEETDKKITIYKRDNNGFDAYLIAAANGHVDTMKYLESIHNWNIHTKSEIIKDNKYKSKTRVIKHDGRMIMPFFVNPTENQLENDDSFRFDAFILSIINVKKNVFEYLLTEHHWRLHFTDRNGNDPYLIAAFHGQCAMMNHLDTLYRWNIGSVNNDGENAFLVAARGGQIQCMNYVF